MSTKEFNSTRTGQMALCADASSRATAFQMNAIIKSKGGIGWPHDMVANAEPILLSSIKANMVEEYNKLIGENL